MKAENQTCIQRVTLTFALCQTDELQECFRIGNGSIESLDRWQEQLDKRLERVKGMLKVLQNISTHWTVSIGQDCLVLETDRIDYPVIIASLAQAGYSTKEFKASLEYLRKWGVL